VQPTSPQGGRPGRGGRVGLRRLLKGGLKGIPKGAILLSVIALLNVLLGFVREGVTAYYFGTSAELDAFLVATTLPRLITTHAVQITVSIILPLYVAHLEAGRREDATLLLQRWWRFLFKVMTGFCVVVGLLSTVVVRLIGPGLTDGQLDAASEWLRWLLPFVWATTLSGCFKVVLDQNRRFFAPAMSAAFVSVAIIGSAALFHDRMGVASMIPGFILGALVGFTWQWGQSRAYEPKLMTWREIPDHIKLPLAGGGIMVLNSLAQEANLIIDRAFASQLPEGSIAALNYAKAFTTVPQTVIGAALATALFPVLAEKVARGAWKAAFRTTFTWTLIVLAFCAIPVSAIVIWRHDLIRIVFQRGAFGGEATAMTSTVVSTLTFMVLVMAANALVMRLLLAQQQLRLIMTTTILTVVLKIALNFALIDRYGLTGVSVAIVASQGIAVMVRYLGAWRYAPADRPPAPPDA